MEDGDRTLLFEIGDGATHWVAANSYRDALKIAAESMGFKDISDWENEVGNKATISVYMKDELRVVQDSGVPEDYPQGCELVVIIPREAYHKLPHGLVATTEY